MESTKTKFVCKDTGRELFIKKVPFTVTDQIISEYEKKVPPPNPPYDLIDYGEGEKRREPNVLHPVYLRLVREYESKKAEWVTDAIRHLYTQLSIECEIDEEPVRIIREFFRGMGVELDKDDKYVYVWYVCIGTTDGYRELVEAIQRRSGPTEGAVKEAQDRFQS